VPSGSGQIENLRIAAGQLNAALSNRVRDLGSIDKGIILSGVMDYDRCAVIMFTKDNADRLRITLPQFSDKPVRTILLDDSTTDDTQRLFASRFGQTNIEYHGRTQQDAVLAQMEQRLGEFITPLGTPRWHLGNCRNYAVWLALSRNLERVILIDDDILLSDSAQVLATLNLLSQFPVYLINILVFSQFKPVKHSYSVNNYKPNPVCHNVLQLFKAFLLLLKSCRP